MIRERLHILGFPVDNLTMDETVSLILDSIEKRVHLHHVVVNVAKLVFMKKNKSLRDAVTNSDIINVDGQGVAWGLKFLRKPILEKVSGIDLMEKLVDEAHTKGLKIYFLGAKEEVIQKVISKYTSKYSNDIIAGYRNGYFTEDEEDGIATEIANSKADILFVAITSPKKEIFLDTFKHIIDTPFIMGVGGSFDVVSGMVKRAPVWMQKFGLEWLYRVIQEPKRMWKRYLYTNSLFFIYILREKLGL